MISSESSSSFCEFPPFSPFCELTKVFSEAGLAVVSETTEPGEELAGRLFWNRKARNELILSSQFFAQYSENSQVHTENSAAPALSLLKSLLEKKAAILNCSLLR